MRFHYLYEGESQQKGQDLLLGNNNKSEALGHKRRSKKKNNNINNLIYRYDWLIGEHLKKLPNLRTGGNGYLFVSMHHSH
jgi:hypothetical protein